MEGDERLRAGPELAWRERDHVGAIDVEPRHQVDQLGQEGLALLGVPGHHVHAQLLARPMLIGRSGQEDDQPRVACADEVEPELHTREHAPGGQVEVHVLNRPLSQAGSARQAALTQQIGEADLQEALVVDAHPHELGLAVRAGQIGLQRHLHVRVLEGVVLLRDHGLLGRVGPEVGLDALEQRAARRGSGCAHGLHEGQERRAKARRIEVVVGHGVRSFASQRTS